MEKLLFDLGLNAYEVGGIIGLLVFFICVLVFVVFSLYARRVKSQPAEIREARNEVKDIQLKMRDMMQEMLEECEKTCAQKDELIIELQRQIEVYHRNEIFLNNEIENLCERVRELEKAR